MRQIQFACHQTHAQVSDMRGLPKATVALALREHEVQQWLVLGRSNSGIAELLAISTHTVDTLVRRLFEKLSVNSQVDAAPKAVGLGLVAL